MSDRLLPPNATPAEIALEETTARLSAVPVPPRDMWDPDTCPENLLPWLAWAFNLDGWGADWTTAQKRESIKQAVTVHRYKGTIGAVREALAALGFNASVREWFNVTPNDAPYTFDLLLGVDQVGIGELEQNKILNVVLGTKNLRSHLDEVLLEVNTKAHLVMAGVTKMGNEITLPFGGELPDPIAGWSALLLNFDEEGMLSNPVDSSSHNHEVNWAGGGFTGWGYGLPASDVPDTIYGDALSTHSGGAVALTSAHPEAVAMIGAQPFTLEGFAYPQDTDLDQGFPAVGVTLFQLGAADSAGSIRVRVEKRGGLAWPAVSHCDGAGWVSMIEGNRELPLSEWTHIALQRGGQTFSLYVGGQLAGQASPMIEGETPFLENHDVFVGIDPDEPEKTFRNGRIDSVRLTMTDIYPGAFVPPVAQLGDYTNEVPEPADPVDPPTPPGPAAMSYVAGTNVVYQTSSTSVAANTPAGVQAGDCLLAIVMARADITPPYGWSLVAESFAPVGTSGVSQRVGVYRKDWADPGDANASVTWTQASAGRMGVCYQLHRGTYGDVIVAESATSFANEPASTIAPPVLTATKANESFVVVATFVGANASASTTISAPAGSTLTCQSGVAQHRLSAAYRYRNAGETNGGVFTSTHSPVAFSAAALTIRLQAI